MFNSGTAAALTPTPITIGATTVKTNHTIFTRFFPADDTGPLPDAGMVKTFKPTKVRGAVDFRRIRDGKTSRQLMFVTGSTLYSFNLSDSTLTAQYGGLFKNDRPVDMVVFNDVLYFADGGNVLAWDGSEVRNAGIKAPVMRPSVTFATTGGTIDSGTYLLAYRFVNSDAGLRSNMSPLNSFTIGGNDLGTITKIHGIQVPTDPQVNAIEIFCTAEGDASAMYRLAVIEDVTFSSIIATSGEWDNDGNPLRRSEYGE